MTTSAQALQKLFTQINGSSDSTQPFLRVAADKLDMSGEAGPIDAAQVIIRLILDVERDIALLDSDPDELHRLNRKLSQFKGIKNFSQLHLDLKSAKANFLKADNLVGLSEIHFALEGKVLRSDIDRSKAQALAKKFREIAGEINNAGLPRELCTALVARALKMAAILDHYYAFGSIELRSELEGLVGAIAITKSKAEAQSKSVLTKFAGLAMAGLGILAVVDKGLDDITSISQNTELLIESLNNGADN